MKKPERLIAASLLASAGAWFALAPTGCEIIAFTDRSAIGDGEAKEPSFKLSPSTSNDGSTSAVCLDDAAVACWSPAECPAAADDCVTSTCKDGCCGTELVAEGELCTGGICNAQGSCVQCLVDVNCNAPQPSQCIVNKCASQKCATAFAAAGTACQDHDGSVCDGAGKCVQCNVNADCGAQACNKNHLCVPPSCANGIEDGAETDVDCGGGTCPACGDFEKCVTDSDCAAGVCDKYSHTCGG